MAGRGRLARGAGRSGSEKAKQARIAEIDVQAAEEVRLDAGQNRHR